jgi:hypothetical protein
LHVTGRHVGEARGSAAIGSDDEIETGEFVEGDGRDVTRRAERGGREGPSLRFPSRLLQKLGDGIRREIGRHDEKHRRHTNTRDRCEVGHRIVGRGEHNLPCHHVRRSGK